MNVSAMGGHKNAVRRSTKGLTSVAKRVHSIKALAYSSLPSSKGLSGVQSIKELNVDKGANIFVGGGGFMSESAVQSPSFPSSGSSAGTSAFVRFNRRVATRVLDIGLALFASSLSFPLESSGARKTSPPYPLGISIACPYICLPRNAATKRLTFLDARVFAPVDMNELSSCVESKVGCVSKSIPIAVSSTSCVAVACSTWLTISMEDLVMEKVPSSTQSFSLAKLPMDVIDDTVVRLLFVSVKIEVDDELATRVAVLEDRSDRAVNGGGAGLGRK